MMIYDFLPNKPAKKSLISIHTIAKPFSSVTACVAGASGAGLVS
jgi:hypothetical protein